MLRATLIATAVAAALVGASTPRPGTAAPTTRMRPRQLGPRVLSAEVREATINGANPLDVDTGGNGGIIVRGSEQRADVHMRAARIVARADTEAEARQLASGVRNRRQWRHHPRRRTETDRDSSWSVAISSTCRAT